MTKFLVLTAALVLGCAPAYATQPEDGIVRMHSSESVVLHAGANVLYCERHNRAMRKSFKTDFTVAEDETWTATCVQGRVRFEASPASS
jgi:hypothetical protein